MRRSSAFNGLFWSVIDMGGGQVLSFLAFLVLARLLVPEEYGTFALAAAFLSFGSFLLQGLAPAVIHMRSISDLHTSTAFWTSLAVAAVLAGVANACAASLAALFHNPMLAPVVRWMSLVCIPMALANVPLALFRRELRMSAYVARTVTGYIAGAAVSIPMALHGFGALSLAFGQISQWVTTVIVVYAVSSWRPKLRFSVPAFLELGRYSAHYIAAITVGFFTANVDMWILGLWLDARSLGHYALALRLLEAVRQATTAPVERLALPLLSPLRSDPAEFRAQYQRVVIGATSVWLPAVAGIGLVAARLLPIAFGEKWADSVPVVQAMCLSAFTFSLTTFTGDTLSAWGRPDAYSKLQLVRLAITVVAFGVAAPLGTVAAGLAWALLPAVMLPIHLITLHSVAGFRPTPMLAAWFKLAASGLAMIAAVLTLGRFAPFGSWLPIAEIALGAAVYVILLDRVMLPGSVVHLVQQGLGAVPAFASQVKR